MHRYRMITHRCGAVVEVTKCYAFRMRKGHERDTNYKTKTAEESREANRRQAAKKLERLINANFRPGDLHVILTYIREKRPEAKEVQKRLKNFLSAMRTWYRKRGKEFRYVCATEYKSKSIHHHLVINKINDGKETSEDYIRKIWKEYGHPKYVPLYEDAEYAQLADYLIKETDKTFRDPDSPVKQRYSCSRNLVQPKVTRRDVKTKRGWEKDPKPWPGYYIKKDSLYNGFDKLGYEYQTYTMVKLNPTDADWPSDDLQPVKRKRRKHSVSRKC